MQLCFLGGATTVTGSQFLLDTGDARVLIDCGMFQGSPNETVRNRLPFAYEPRDVDALLMTHAHLDHCGHAGISSSDALCIGLGAREWAGSHDRAADPL